MPSTSTHLSLCVLLLLPTVVCTPTAPSWGGSSREKTMRRWNGWGSCPVLYSSSIRHEKYAQNHKILATIHIIYPCTLISQTREQIWKRNYLFKFTEWVCCGSRASMQQPGSLFISHFPARSWLIKWKDSDFVRGFLPGETIAPSSELHPPTLYLAGSSPSPMSMGKCDFFMENHP